MNNIKKVASNFVLSSDMLSAPVALRYGGNSDYQSYCTGCVSIVTVSVFIVIFIIKFLSVLQLQDITAFQHLSDNLQSSQPINDIMFAMTIDGLGMTTIDKYFEFTVTQVTLSRPSGSTAAKTRTQRTILLLPCKIDYWLSMNIQDMSTIFNKRGMSAYYCPTQQFKIQGTSDQDTYVYSQIRLSQCNTSSPHCQPNAVTRNQYYTDYVTNNSYFTVKLFIKDSIISPTNQNAVSNYIQRDVLLTFSTTTGTIGYIKIADYQIDTDTNILPWSSYQTQSGYYIDRFQTTTVPVTSKYLYLKLQKSTKMLTVERQYGKIDDMLSYVGGLFGLLFWCIQFVMASYNQYRYQLGVGQTLFNYDNQGNQTKSQQMGFWTYIKYSIYQWLYFLGCQIKSWTSMKQINQTRQQVNQQLDVRYILNKIRYLQNVTQIMISDQQRICLLLTQLPTMNKIQKIRKVSEFYNSQKKNNLDKDKQMKQMQNGSQNHLLNQPNQTNILLTQNPNQQMVRNMDDNIAKQTNKVADENGSQLQNEVCDAILKVMQNKNDPINEKIITRLKPQVMNKIRRKSVQIRSDILQIQMKKQQRRNTK